MSSTMNSEVTGTLFSIEDKVNLYSQALSKLELSEQKLIFQRLKQNFPENILEEAKDYKINFKNIDSIHEFYSTFKKLKESCNLCKERNFQIDNFIKKAKAKFLFSIHEALKFCFNIYIMRLPQEFILNIKIEFNKKYFNKTVEDIYLEFNKLPSFDEIKQRNLIKKNKKEFAESIMKSTLKDSYQMYIQSNLFKNDIESIEKKQNAGILFNFVAINLIDYFYCSKGNKRSKDKYINDLEGKLLLSNIKNKFVVKKQKNNN